MIIDDIKFYMIQMSDNPISQHYKNLVLPSWKDYNIHMFEAVTPKTLNKYNLKFNQKFSHGGYGVDFTPTEKAIWCSHYALWKNCITLNKKLIVIEHDMKLDTKQGLVTKSFSEHNGVGLGRTYSDRYKRNINLPCGCYYITPTIAKHLTKFIDKDPAGIRINPDGHIKKFLDTDKSNWCVDHIIDKKIGTTIEHNKTS